MKKRPPGRDTYEDLDWVLSDGGRRKPTCERTSSKIARVTDIGCDLPPELRERHGIETMAIVVRFGTE